MSTRKSKPRRRDELTPVDDVRVVREQLARDANHDVETLVKQSRAFGEQTRAKLGVRLVSPTSRTRRPTTTKRRSG